MMPMEKTTRKGKKSIEEFRGLSSEFSLGRTVEHLLNVCSNVSSRKLFNYFFAETNETNEL